MMEVLKTGKVAGLTAVAGLLALAVAGCSSPKADFEATCEENSGDVEGCACMGERLDKNLSEEQFGELVKLMREEDASLEQIGTRLDQNTFQEIMIAAKQCEANP
ncbi:hypothetical protein [Guyparkeria sp. SB14A]|uniref:hypothetical protein n=1 Tax=Guyparkeria sp. SB14A TaxID=2571147 RepID=UPI001FFD0E9E|nr:hypothetical protein [Guyparkeria sp. SB14A]